MGGAVRVITGITLSLVGFGCATAPGPIISTERTHVLILSGCNGTTKKVETFRRMIDEEVDGTSCQVWDWSRIRPATLLVNQYDLPRNMFRVHCLVRELVAWRERHPHTRLHLIGFSGGAAIALWAVEQLPEDFGVERVVLIGGSVAPDYDLTTVLERTSRGVFNYHSLADRNFLREGTLRHGTMERKYAVSAGYSGFVLPDDPELAVKLDQCAWNRSMKQLGNHGGHWGPFAAPFLRTYFLPLFDEPRAPYWTAIHARLAAEPVNDTALP